MLVRCTLQGHGSAQRDLTAMPVNARTPAPRRLQMHAIADGAFATAPDDGEHGIRHFMPRTANGKYIAALS